MDRIAQALQVSLADIEEIIDDDLEDHLASDAAMPTEALRECSRRLASASTRINAALRNRRRAMRRTLYTPEHNEPPEATAFAIDGVLIACTTIEEALDGYFMMRQSLPRKGVAIRAMPTPRDSGGDWRDWPEAGRTT